MWTITSPPFVVFAFHVHVLLSQTVLHCIFKGLWKSSTVACFYRDRFFIDQPIYFCNIDDTNRNYDDDDDENDDDDNNNNNNNNTNRMNAKRTFFLRPML